jgi:hypothetical protein
MRKEQETFEVAMTHLPNLGCNLLLFFWQEKIIKTFQN